MKKIELTEDEKDKIAMWYSSGLSFRNIYRNYGYTAIVARRVLVERNIRIRDRFEKQCQKKTSENASLPLNESGKKFKCSKVGKKCIYRGRLGNSDYFCDYIGKIGKRRGCEPEECTKFIPRGGHNDKAKK